MQTSIKGFDLSIEMDDFTLSYDDIGEGTIPIIFLHGFPFTKAMWSGQLNFLSTTHRVIACDIRGFGRSTDVDAHLSIDMFSDDVIAFMDALDIDRAIICGLSMGGFIALNLVKQHPERFTALMLCNTQCIADTAEVKAGRYVTIDAIKANGAAAFNEKFVHSVFHADSLVNKKPLLEELRSVVFANADHTITRGLIALGERSETCTTLHDIAIPTLIIGGRADVVTPLVQSEFMHQHITGSVLRVIEEAGHVSNLEQPDEFNGYLRDFLSTLTTAK
jgi:3-oxoadipate enol-lactonase